MDYFFRTGPEPEEERGEDLDIDGDDGREGAENLEVGENDFDDDGENDWWEERGESERDSGENLEAWEGEYDSRVGPEDIRGESNLEKSRRVGEILRSGYTDERLVSLDG